MHTSESTATVLAVTHVQSHLPCLLAVWMAGAIVGAISENYAIATLKY